MLMSVPQEMVAAVTHVWIGLVATNACVLKDMNLHQIKELVKVFERKIVASYKVLHIKKLFTNSLFIRKCQTSIQLKHSG